MKVHAKVTGGEPERKANKINYTKKEKRNESNVVAAYGG